MNFVLRLISLCFLSVSLLIASTKNDDAESAAKYRILSPVQVSVSKIFECVYPDTKISNFTLYNTESLGALLQGLSRIRRLLTWYLEPYMVFNKPIHFSALSDDEKGQLFFLPQFPEDLKTKQEDFALQVFFFPGNAFGKVKNSTYLYAARPIEQPADEKTVFLTALEFKDTVANLDYSIARIMQKFEYIFLLNYLSPKVDKAIFPNVFKMYSFFADFGIREAEFKLGECFLKGIGTPIDRNLAFEFFDRAAETGMAKALYMCGWMHYTFRKDTKKAIEYLKEASDRRHVQAKSLLKKAQTAK